MVQTTPNLVDVYTSVPPIIGFISRQMCTHEPNSDISCVTSNISVKPCSVTAELPNRVETWKILQVCLVDAKGCNISKWVDLNGTEWLLSGKQVCHTVTLQLVQRMLLWQLCMYGTSGEKRVILRDEQVLDHVMWTQHGMTAILSTWPSWQTIQPSSTVSSRRWSTAKGLDLSAWTVCCCLLRAGLVARMPLHQPPLSRDHQCLRLHCACECCHWCAEWRNVFFFFFLDDSPFNMGYNDGRIHVQHYAGEHNLKACILQQHRGLAPSVMVWGDIGYNMWSCFLCIEGNLNSNH